MRTLPVVAGIALFAILGAACFSTELTASAQDQLTQAEVEAAIARGKSEDINKIGLSVSVNFGAGLKWARSNVGPPVVAAYTPATWIARHAADARRNYRDFSASDVTADMKKPVLRLFANDPYLVSMIVLKSVDDSQVVRPAETINTCNTPEGANMMTFVPQRFIPFVSCAQYQFSMADLERVQDDKGEFVIDAITPQVEEKFKVRNRDLRNLF